MFTFNHAGKIGDILYSLYYCIESSAHSGFSQFNYNIQINKRIIDFGASSLLPPSPSADNMQPILTEEDAEFLKPLLDSQPYVNSVTALEEPKKGAIDLNSFRSGVINPNGCEIRDWYYTFNVHTLPRQFWKKIIHVEPNRRYRNKILFTLTERNVNQNIDYNELKAFDRDLVFIGTDREYQTFRKKFFELDRVELKKDDSLLTVAEYLAGAKGYLANQSGFFSLAELMKIPRILLPPDFILSEEGKGGLELGPRNNLPLGGWANSVSFTPKMVAAVKELLRIQA